jgi:tRNA threonylcarbamoyladenosine biosynthesis protein TsaB
VIVFALDTALAATSVAVVDDERVLAVRIKPMDRGHQEHLAPLARAAMEEAGVGFAAVERIAVTVGPGSFTGLRVGLAFAKGLALALNAPCAGVGVLPALAASSQATGRIAAVVNARPGGLYLQRFFSGSTLGPAGQVTPEEALEILGTWTEGSATQPLTVVGAGGALLGSLEGARFEERTYPDPLAVARLGRLAPSPLLRPRPLYLRAPDAKTLAERRGP